ncbi:unnamed protein product, partial [Closterium sp. NIES-53]
GIHLEAYTSRHSTTQVFKLYHEKGGLYIGKAVLKNNVFVLHFVPDLGTADSDGISTSNNSTLGSIRTNTSSSRDNIGSSKDNIGSSRDNIGSSRNNGSSSSSNIDTNRWSFNNIGSYRRHSTESCAAA